MSEPAEPANVLLIEDDDIDYKTLYRAFDKVGASERLFRVVDAKAALDLLERDEMPVPFFIVLDLNMPRMGGLEFLKQLRADPRWRNTVVVVLTTSDNPIDVEDAYAFNIAGYFVKCNGLRFAEVVKLLTMYSELAVLPKPSG